MAESARFLITSFTENISTPKINQLNLLNITTSKKMTGDRKQIPCPDKKGIDGKNLKIPKTVWTIQTIYQKKKNNIDIGPLITEETMTEIKGNTK